MIKTKVKAQDAVLEQFSSGSTARPKLARRTHSNLLKEAENISQTIKISSRDKILCAVPLFHAYGFGTGMLSAIYSGAALILVNRFRSRRILNILRQEKVSIFFAVPYMFRMLAHSLDKRMRLPALKYCFSAGISLPEEVCKKFYSKFGVFVRDLYGTTETGCLAINLGRRPQTGLNSVGLPIKGAKIEIFLRKGHKKAKAGQKGEIAVKTPTCALKRSYFYTGDIGKVDKGGNLYILGRKTSFINVAGMKVDPKEVEEVLNRHPGVKEAVVLAAPDKLRGEVVKAVVVPESSVLDKKALLKYCRKFLADFKLPRVIEFRDKLPRSSLGKILKGYL